MMFDEDASWLPPKNRPFTLKHPKLQQEPEPKPEQKKTSDKEGLDRAYAADSGFYKDPAGTLHIAGTRGGFLEPDWMENYKSYGPGLLKTLSNMYGKLESGKFGWKDWYSTGQPFDIEGTEVYQRFDQYMKDHPGEIKNLVAHSKGASVAETWMEKHPEFTGHARLYGTPHIDVIGSENFKDYLNQVRQERHEYYTKNFGGPSWLGKVADDFENKRQDFTEWLTGFDKVKGMREKHQLRISGPMDPATALDGSAMQLDDPTYLNHLGDGGGHYYRNIAELYAGFDGEDGDGFIARAPKDAVAPAAPKWGITWDIQKSLTQPWNNTTPTTTDPMPN